MASTFTDRNRLTKQGIGENESTWGDILNTVIDLVDEALDGVLDVDVSAGDVTLTANNGSDDEARNRVLRISGEPGVNRTITIPDAQKIYYVDVQVSGSANVTIKNVSDTTGIMVSAASENQIIMCDGTSTISILGGFTLENESVTTSILATSAVSGDKLNSTVITGQTSASVVPPDFIIFADVSSSSGLRKTTVSSLLELIYPVGSLYFNAESSTNPATLLGFGTWVAYAKGRALVGVGTGTDENGVDFTVSVGAEWGEYEHTQTESELANHFHHAAYPTNVGPGPGPAADTTITTGYNSGGDATYALRAVANEATVGKTSEVGGSDPMQWSQPSIGIYIWRRTS